ncbi:hypothetical protein ES703_19461 [subsurface metagenome]
MELKGLMERPVGGRKRDPRKDNFFVDTDPYHNRMEILRELILKTRRINRHFELICKKMKTHAYHICDPGPFILAPFVNDLGIVQSFGTYGPPKLLGKEITNLAMLNIFRILAGYRRISHLSNLKDRSVALAS